MEMSGQPNVQMPPSRPPFLDLTPAAGAVPMQPMQNHKPPLSSTPRRDLCYNETLESQYAAPITKPH